VVQSDDLPLSTWIIAPTSAGRRAASFRPEITIEGVTTRVLVEQLTVVDPRAFGRVRRAAEQDRASGR
jgi:mRNA interferase MazF